MTTHSKRKATVSAKITGKLVSEERLDDDRLAREALIAKIHNLEHEIEVARRERDVRVRIGLLEKDERVLPNMGVQVGFVSGAGEEVPAQVNQSETRIES